MPKKKDKERVRHAETLRGTNHTKLLNGEGEFRMKMHSIDSSCQEVSNQTKGTEKPLREIKPSGGFSLEGNVFWLEKLDRCISPCFVMMYGMNLTSQYDESFK